MDINQAWAIYHKSPMYKSQWEHSVDQPSAGSMPGRGLLLPVCAHCGHAATRQTYVGFWQTFITLIQDYVVTALVQCPNCHKYNKYIC